jgi:hypothetical protein
VQCVSEGKHFFCSLLWNLFKYVTFLIKALVMLFQERVAFAVSLFDRNKMDTDEKIFIKF